MSGVVSLTVHQVFLEHLPAALTHEETEMLDFGILAENPDLDGYVRPLTRWERSQMPEGSSTRIACAVQRCALDDAAFSRLYGAMKPFAFGS